MLLNVELAIFKRKYAWWFNDSGLWNTRIQLERVCLACERAVGANPELFDY